MMSRVELVAGRDRRNEFDRHEVGPLVQQLEDGVLRVGTDPAPRYGRCCTAARFTTCR